MFAWAYKFCNDVVLCKLDLTAINFYFLTCFWKILLAFSLSLIVPKMTYYVSSGTLNSTNSLAKSDLHKQSLYS